jgi:polar amino acid transport system substrate-binding protein
MKKYFITLLALLITIPVFCQELNLQLASDIWPPFTNKGDQQSLALNIVKTALSRSGVRVSNRILEFDKVIKGIRDGEHDGSAALWKNDERAEFLIFSEPYLYNQLILVGKKGSSVEAQTLKELEGKSLAVVGSYAYGALLDGLEKVDLVVGESDQENLHKLMKGEVDYILVDALLIQYLLNFQRDEAFQYLEIGKTTLIKKSLHFGLRNNFPDAEQIIKNFNREILLMAADGSYNKILHLHWIRADIDGDGNTELVLEGKYAGEVAPTESYSVMHSKTGSDAKFNSRYYVAGNFYQSWESIPEEYKRPRMKEEDLSKIGLLNLRF